MQLCMIDKKLMPCEIAWYENDNQKIRIRYFLPRKREKEQRIPEECFWSSIETLFVEAKNR